MARGGKRQGAGRPEGTTGIKHKPATSKAVALTREAVRDELNDRVERMAGSKLRAVDVMEENMLWTRGVAEIMLKKCEDAFNKGAEQIPVAIDFLGESIKLRAFSQKCAEGLAPFQTPRLSATVPEPEALEVDPSTMRDVTPVGEDRLAHITQRFVGKRDLTIVPNGAKKTGT